VLAVLIDALVVLSWVFAQQTKVQFIPSYHCVNTIEEQQEQTMPCFHKATVSHSQCWRHCLCSTGFISIHVYVCVSMLQYIKLNTGKSIDN
jgi:hypothetical protein